MKITEENLDYFRHILIDLEVTHVAAINREAKLHKIYNITDLTPAYLTDKHSLAEEYELNDDETRLVKFEYKDNYLQLTINPTAGEKVYYHNHPENPELIFAQPYDFLVTEGWLLIFLPTKLLDLKSVMILKATFSEEVENIETISVAEVTPKTIITYLEREDQKQYHDIRVYDQLFCSNFRVLENFIGDLEIAEKKDFVQIINSYNDPYELLLACGKLANSKDLDELAFLFFDAIDESSNLYGEATLEKLFFFYCLDEAAAFLAVVTTYPYQNNIPHNDFVMNEISKALCFGFLDKKQISDEFIKYHDQWIYKWREISVEPLSLIFADNKVQQFIDEQLKPKNKDTILRVITFLVTEYYHCYTSCASKPNRSYASWDSKLLNLSNQDLITRKKIEEECGEEEMAFGRLLLYIDAKYICGEVYNSHKGYKF